MGQSIHVEILDRLTGTRTVEHCELPLEIGKQPTAQNHILLDAKYPTISRVHGKLSVSGPDLIYADCSSNGTKIDGTLLKGAERKIKRGEIFQIENYDIKVLDTSPVLIKHTGPTLNELSQSKVEAGETLLLTQANNQLAILPASQQDDVDQSEATIVGKLTLEGDRIVLEISDEALLKTVTVNRSPVEANKTEAQIFDVIGVGGDRIEVLRSNHEKIVCGNPACHLLNDLPYEENCIWCGYYLAASGSFTRVTLS